MKKRLGWILLSSLLLSCFLIGSWVWKGFTERTPLTSSASPTGTLTETRPAERGIESADPSGSKKLEKSELLDSTATASDKDPEVQKNLQVLQDIFKSKNDNDPRLDRELKDLSPKTREAFRAEYQKLPKEALNERGTVVYLLGRNLQTSQDFDFIEKVLRERPCLSLSDCNRLDPEKPDAHSESTSEVTRTYPQRVAQFSIETYAKDHPESERAQLLLKLRRW